MVDTLSSFFVYRRNPEDESKIERKLIDAIDFNDLWVKQGWSKIPPEPLAAKATAVVEHDDHDAEDKPKPLDGKLEPAAQEPTATKPKAKPKADA